MPLQSGICVEAPAVSTVCYLRAKISSLSFGGSAGAWGYWFHAEPGAVQVGAPRGSGTLIVGKAACVSSRKQSCFAAPVVLPIRWRSRELARTDFVIGYYCRNLRVLKHTPAPSGMLTGATLSCLAFPRMIHRRTSPRLGFTESFTGLLSLTVPTVE